MRVLLVASLLLAADAASARNLWDAEIAVGAGLGKDGTNALTDLPDIFRRIPDAPDQTGIGLLVNYGRVDARGGIDVETLELPIDHRFNLRRWPNLSFLLSFPITATFTNGQWSAMASLGLGAQYRPFEWWALTPIFRVGAVGSIDVGALAVPYSATLTSDIHFPLDRFLEGAEGVEVHIVNQGGVTQTFPFTVGTLDIDYDLTNGVFRNGGYVRGVFGNSSWGWRFFGQNTSWAGDDLFFDSTADIGVALLRMAEAAGFPYESLGLELSYFGEFEDYNGVSLML